MRASLAVLLILPCIASFACGSEEEEEKIAPHTVHVSVPDRAVAIGEPVHISAGVQSSDDHRDEYPPGGCASRPSSIVPYVTITRATCAPVCTADVQSGTSVRVLATSAGRKLLRLDLWKSTGEQLFEDVHIEYRIPTRITATRQRATSPSGSRYLIIGDTQTWTLGVADESGSLLVDTCKIQVSGSGPILAERSCDSTRSDKRDTVAVSAKAQGDTSFTFSYAGLARTETVRAVSPSRARSVVLHEVFSDGGRSTDIAAQSDREPVGPPHSLVFRYRCGPERNAIVPRLELDDGTIAYGGAASLRSEPRDGLVVEQRNQTALVTARPFDGRIRAELGAALLDRAYEVRPGCSNVDELPDAAISDAGDAGISDDAAVSGDARAGERDAQ